MRWLLAGYCTLVNLSVAVGHMVTQMPRFYGVGTGQRVVFHCRAPINQQAYVKWYKTSQYDDAPPNRVRLENPDVYNIGLTVNASLHLSSVALKDSGVYFCKMNNTWGPGSELQVVRKIDRKNAEYRSKVKDGLMVLQAVLLTLVIAALLQNKQALTKKMDSEYEEPETNHIYEGLAIENCGGLYEELSIYAQPEGAEAPWE